MKVSPYRVIRGIGACQHRFIIFPAQIKRPACAGLDRIPKNSVQCYERLTATRRICLHHTCLLRLCLHRSYLRRLCLRHSYLRRLCLRHCCLRRLCLRHCCLRRLCLRHTCLRHTCLRRYRRKPCSQSSARPP
ncbi:MAG: pentapeptide repeat-containing protein [Proteobacteria bacterium]|nr:pentapeptide repeat-containing protein [Pseudomonadota bacterium]